MEAEHEFTLILDGVSDLTPELMDSLFEAGCDDATVSRQAGRILMDFDRAAPTRTRAILSAIQDVRKANIGARVLRVEESPLARDDRGVAAINSALTLALTSELDPQLFNDVMLLVGSDHSGR
jgi:hypothetical protein